MDTFAALPPECNSTHLGDCTYLTIRGCYEDDETAENVLCLALASIGNEMFGNSWPTIAPLTWCYSSPNHRLTKGLNRRGVPTNSRDGRTIGLFPMIWVLTLNESAFHTQIQSYPIQDVFNIFWNSKSFYNVKIAGIFTKFQQYSIIFYTLLSNEMRKFP